MDRENNNVVDLILPERGNKKATFKVVAKPTHSLGCKHLNCEVDEHLRVVKCNGCGKIIDPFDWMLASAKEERRIYYEALSVDHETKKRRESIEELKRIERNYKSRIANARKKVGDTLTDDILNSICFLEKRDMREKLEVGNVLTMLKKLVTTDEPPKRTSLKAENGIFPKTKIYDESR